MPIVSIVKGSERKENIRKAINLIEPRIDELIKEKNSDALFIKINTIDPNFPNANTHPDALEAVLEYFYEKFDEIIIGDNSFAFTKKKNPYKHLKKAFPKIAFSDMEKIETEKIIFECIKGTKEAEISLLPKNAFTISLALPKTHDAVVYTGCSKNMLGCVVKNRNMVHGTAFYKRIFFRVMAKSNWLTHKNLVKVISFARPDLSVLDGFVGMQGNGPIFGSPIELNFAMCSDDCIALDFLAAKSMGFKHVPYLLFCNKYGAGTTDLKKIGIAFSGFEKWEEICKEAKPHRLYKYQVLSEYDGFNVIDFRMLLEIFSRFYRLKDKIIDKIKKNNSNIIV